MVQKLKLTIVTQLHEGSNRCLIEYMEASRRDYGKALREAFYAVRRGGLNKSKYNNISRVNTVFLGELQTPLFLTHRGDLMLLRS